MINNYTRCDTCTHHYCERHCKDCPMWKLEKEIPEYGEGCGCLAYRFDVNSDCPFYEEDKE